MARLILLLALMAVTGACAPAGYTSGVVLEPVQLDSARTPVVGVTAEQAIAARTRQVAQLQATATRQQERKVGPTYVTMLVSGTVIGVAGGVVGLTADADDAKKAGSITSLVSGALTGLIAALGLDSRAKNRDACLSLIRERMLYMNTRWDDAAFIQATADGRVSDEVFRAYNEDVQQTNTLLRELKCN